MRFSLIALFIFLRLSALAQPVLPHGYFRNPLDIAPQLSGNFGELRPNHFHMGLDLKTRQQVNLPVHAAAEGYVARVKVEPFGFGQAIYLNHPNGFSTVYGHLNAFYPALQAWVKSQQYRLHSWAVYLDVPPGLFPVSKGQLIAYSGSTGGSQAPHLHFEIRRTATDVNINPLLFGFPLADRSKPRILRLAIYDRMRSLYEQSPLSFPVQEQAAGYYSTKPALLLLPDSLISLGITAFDTQGSSPNQNGIYEASLEFDGKPVIRFSMDSMSYNDTRYVNALIDYRTRQSGGPFIQLLTELPGYMHAVYEPQAGNGIIHIGDGKIHAVRVLVKDAYGNQSVLACRVRYQGKKSSALTAGGKMFYPLMLDGFESPDCEFYLGERCLYDSVHIHFSRAEPADTEAVSALFDIGSRLIPLQEAFLVRIKPIRNLQPAEIRHCLMECSYGSTREVAPVSWQNGWASAHFRSFGRFRLLIDQEPPAIIPLDFAEGADLSKSKQMSFRVRDNFPGNITVVPELDGQWICFSNDKGRSYIYHFDEHCGPGEHSLVIRATDLAGNETSQTFHFKRN